MTRPENREDFDPQECFHAERAPDEPVGSAIVTAVAAVAGVEPDALPPIGEVVDPDALDGLLSSADGADCWLVFEYEDYEVTVSADGDVWVRELNPP